jgi:MFS family permease
MSSNISGMDYHQGTEDLDLNRRLAFYTRLSLNAGLSSLFFGYNIASINPFVPDLGNYIHTDNESLQSTVVVMVPLGAIFGSIFGDYIIRNLGRRGGLIANDVLCIVGCGLTIIRSLACIIIGRFISGVGVGV